MLEDSSSIPEFPPPDKAYDRFAIALIRWRHPFLISRLVPRSIIACLYPPRPRLIFARSALFSSELACRSKAQLSIPPLECRAIYHNCDQLLSFCLPIINFNHLRSRRKRRWNLVIDFIEMLFCYIIYNEYRFWFHYQKSINWIDSYPPLFSKDVSKRLYSLSYFSWYIYMYIYYVLRAIYNM